MGGARVAVGVDVNNHTMQVESAASGSETLRHADI